MATLGFFIDKRLGYQMSFRFLLIAILLSISSAQSAYASDAHIVDISVNEKYALLTASASLDGAFTENIEEALMSGMPVTFTFYVKLIRDRSFFWDDNEKTTVIHKVVKYDSFTKEFNAIEIIDNKPPKHDEFDGMLASIKKSHGDTLFSKKPFSFDELSKRYLVLKTLPMVKLWMSRLRNIPLGEKLDYPSDAKYRLEVKAEMDTIKLTPPFNYILFFVSFLNFDTEWATSSPFLLEKGNPPTDRMFVRQMK